MESMLLTIKADCSLWGASFDLCIIVL